MLCVSVILSALFFPCVGFIFRLTSLNEAKCSSIHTLHLPEEEREPLTQHPSHKADSSASEPVGEAKAGIKRGLLSQIHMCTRIIGEWEGKKVSGSSWGVMSPPPWDLPFGFLFFHPWKNRSFLWIPITSALHCSDSTHHFIIFTLDSLLDHLHLLLQNNFPLFSTPLCYILYPSRWTISLFNPLPSDFLLYTTQLK